MNVKLSGPMVGPKSGEPEQLAVLLHGYGSDGRDLIALAPYLQDILPKAMFIAPNAPQPCAINPGGYEWFPLDLDREISRLENISATRPLMAAFLSDLWAQTGLDAGRTLLGGFSQGAMLALDTGLRLDADLMGVLSFSGGLVAGDDPGAAFRARPPVCLIHGDADDVVPVSMSIEGERVLGELGVPVRLHISPGMGHGIAPDGLEAARQFVAGLV